MRRRAAAALVAGGTTLGLLAAVPASQPAGAALLAASSHDTGPVTRLTSSATTATPIAAGHASRLALRPTGLVHAAFSQSTNWSGYAGLTPAGTGIQAAWTVPAVATSSTLRYSASWIGVDGLVSSDATILQTGTEQDTEASGGTSRYYAWLEIYPTPAECFANPAANACEVVEPGDHMEAALVEASPGVWGVYVDDTTRGWTAEGEVDYSGPGTSAEWIEEAPSNSSGTVLPLADFHSVDFSDLGLYQGTTLEGTELAAGNGIEMLGGAGSDAKVIAAPSAPSTLTSTTLQHFTDTYVSAPGAPADVKGTAEAKAVKLSWHAPTSDGGTAISGYTIREYLAGKLNQTVTTTGAATSKTLSGLDAGGAYTFSVAARSAGGYTSTYSSRSATVRPKS